jgi:hypothetical protein
MAFPVTINGRTYTLADFEGLNYVSGFPDALEDFATDAGAAATNATNAAASATAAAASATSAQAALDAIEGFYLGGQASDPTVDLNGNPLTAGDWYFNTGSNSVKIYDGSSFVTLTGVTFDLVDDTTPQLGGNLDLNGNDISGVNATEIAVLDGASSNTVVNSKAVIYGSAGEVTASQVDITTQGDLRLQDSTGGEYVGLQAPATISSSFTLTLPTADGSADQVLTTNGSGVLSFADVGGGGFTQSSLVSLVTDATSVEFTGIPSGTTFIIINMLGVDSDDDQNNWGVALGGSSGYKTSGYTSDSFRSFDGISREQSSSSFLYVADWNSTFAMRAVAYLTRVSSNYWMLSSLNYRGGGGIGYVNLGEELTKLKLQLTNADRDFDGGQVSISYL